MFSFKSKKKQTHKRRTRNALAKIVDLRSLGEVVPKGVRVTLPYVGLIHNNPLSTFQDYLFNLNSVYDPDRTGIGHQPLGIDQWAQLYTKYRVLSCRYVVTVCNAQAGSNISISCSPTNSTTLLNGNNAGEQPRAKNLEIGGMNGMNWGTVSDTVSMPWLVGRTEAEYKAADTCYGIIGSNNPAELAILHVAASSMDTTNLIYDVKIRLYYDVVLYDRVELADS